MEIIQSETLHFPPDIGTIAFIKIQQKGKILILRFLNIGSNEMLGQIFPPMVIEIHGQETNIRGHIRVSESLIEFDAVENSDLFPPEDML